MVREDWTEKDAGDQKTKSYLGEEGSQHTPLLHDKIHAQEKKSKQPTAQGRKRDVFSDFPEKRHKEIRISIKEEEEKRDQGGVGQS